MAHHLNSMIRGICMACDIAPVERESELKESITKSKLCRIASRVAHDVIVFHVERSSEMLT